MGASEPSAGCLMAARELGRLLAERGWIVLTGGRPAGVMAAASAGAKEVPGSLTLGILPGASGAGPDVDVAVFTGMGDARNAINVLTSDVIVACGIEGPRSFLKSLPSAGRLFEGAAPGDVVQILQEKLAIPRGPAWTGQFRLGAVSPVDRE
jgi:hypothetical protein